MVLLLRRHPVLIPRKAMMHVSIASGGQATLCNDVSGKPAVIGGNRALP